MQLDAEREYRKITILCGSFFCQGNEQAGRIDECRLIHPLALDLVQGDGYSPTFAKRNISPMFFYSRQ
jgi:hypothetical protein